MSNKIKINLKQYYPELYNNDYFIEVDQEIVNVFIEFQRAEWNYNQKIKYHKSYYSLPAEYQLLPLSVPIHPWLLCYLPMKNDQPFCIHHLL